MTGWLQLTRLPIARQTLCLKCLKRPKLGHLLDVVALQSQIKECPNRCIGNWLWIERALLSGQCNRWERLLSPQKPQAPYNRTPIMTKKKKKKRKHGRRRHKKIFKYIKLYQTKSIEEKRNNLGNDAKTMGREAAPPPGRRLGCGSPRWSLHLGAFNVHHVADLLQPSRSSSHLLINVPSSIYESDEVGYRLALLCLFLRFC